MHGREQTPTHTVQRVWLISVDMRQCSLSWSRTDFWCIQDFRALPMRNVFGKSYNIGRDAPTLVALPLLRSHDYAGSQLARAAAALESFSVDHNIQRLVMTCDELTDWGDPPTHAIRCDMFCAVIEVLDERVVWLSKTLIRSGGNSTMLNNAQGFVSPTINKGDGTTPTPFISYVLFSPM